MDRIKKEGKKKGREKKMNISPGKSEFIIFYYKVIRYFSLTFEHKTYKKLHMFMADNICSDAS